MGWAWALECPMKWALFSKPSGYFQIDASFKAIKPYVYFISLLIQNNAPIPIGISIGPSEHFYLFNLFFEFLSEIYPSIKIKDFHILSDEGKAKMLAF